MNKGKDLLVLSGPSGSGKDTLMKEILLKDKNMHLSVSATTREMRTGEHDGVDYYFLTKEEFEKRIKNNEFLEYTCYCGNYYGTLKQEVDTFLEKGESVALVIEVEGAANIKKIYPQCTAVFIKPPSMDELNKRLHTRNTESEEAIQARMKRAEEELAFAKDYDYVIINDDIERCTNEIMEIFERR